MKLIFIFIFLFFLLFLFSCTEKNVLPSETPEGYKEVIHIPVQVVPSDISINEENTEIYVLDFYDRLKIFDLETGYEKAMLFDQKSVPGNKSSTWKEYSLTLDSENDTIIVMKNENYYDEFKVFVNPQFAIFSKNGEYIIVSNNGDKIVSVFYNPFYQTTN